MDGLILSLGVFGTIIIGLAIAIGVLGFLSGLYKWIIIFKYHRLNRTEVESGKTGEQAAREMLDKLNLKDVKVEKVGFFAGLIFGNHFSIKRNAVRLRKNILNKSSITAVAMAVQKVAVAEAHFKGDKRVKRRQILAAFGYLAPVIFVPLILLGIILDMAVISHIGVFSIVFTALSLAYFIGGIIAMSLNIKLEKQTSARSEELFTETGILTEDEIAEAHSLYKTYITSYIIDYIYTVLYVVWLTIRLIAKILLTAKKK